MSAPVPRMTVNRTDQSAFIRTLQDIVTTSLASSERVGLLLVSMQYFDRVYASVGHSESSMALSELASRLIRAFGRRAAILRIGAWKFAIILPGLKSSHHGLLAAKKVERLIEAPVDIAGRRVSMEVVQGLAICPDHADSPEELVQYSEMALLGAMESGQSVLLYDECHAEEARRLWQVQLGLTQALADGGLDPHFQAQIELSTGAFFGAEALLRCYDEAGDVMPPDSVVRFAERSGRILHVTSVMLNSALRHAADWPATLNARRVAVNVSASSLKDSELVETVSRALNTWNTAPSDLAIEVTESALMAEPDRAFETLKAFRELGVRVAIDDFGTGYSSLSYFKNIPANELKVDKSFVKNMLHDEDDRRIVSAIINLAHAFDLQVVAEGVEDRATFELLKEMDCDIAQGYWIGKPVSANDFLAWLRKD